MNYKSITKNQQVTDTSEIHQLLAQTEQCQNLSGQVMDLLNQTDIRNDLIKDILYLVKAATRFEAVGIRLKEDDDFPYYETVGFSKSFVKSEKYLCTRNQNGEIILDSEGTPYLECMCGNILRGRTDPSLPFFTEDGSFWSNCTTELLASITERDRQCRTRNRCNKEGFESVALIPIRYDNKIIGLLQLNDSRKNIFTLKLIHFFEDFVSSIGIVLKNKQRDRTIYQFKEKLDALNEESIPFHKGAPNFYTFFNNSPIGMLEEDCSNVKKSFDSLKKRGVEDFGEYFAKHPETVLSLIQKTKVLSLNKAALRVLSVKNKEKFYQEWNSVFNKDFFDVFRQKMLLLSQGETEFNSKPVNFMVHGKEKTILLKLVVPLEHKETLSRVLIYIIDISDIKGKEEELKESEDKYRKIVESTNDAIILADMQTGIIIDCNKKAEILLDLNKHEIAGSHFSELHPPEAVEDYKMIFRCPIKEGVTISKTFFTCRKCNKNIPVSVSSRIITLKSEKRVSAIFRALPLNDYEDSKQYLSSNIKPTCPARARLASTLSQREREVLYLIAMGKTNKQVAELLYISEKTVITHRSRIMNKLNTHKTADLVRYAMKNGFLD
jgi:PAS domain S-box-containing protein